MREIVFDTETTGLSPTDGHRLVEIGCVEIVNRCETGRSFHAYFHPDRDMPAEAERVHGLSIAFLSKHGRFGERAAELIEFLGDAPLVAHNAGFDFAFLNWELGACGLATLLETRMVDTMAIARKRHPGAKLSLDALCTRYGIDRSQRVKHGALIDAQLLATLYVELMGGRQIGLGLADASPTAIAIAEATPDALPAAAIVRPARPHRAAPHELERHRAFVRTLSSPLWDRYAAVEPAAAAG